MKLVCVTIVKMLKGPDLVTIETDMPNLMWPFTNKLHLDFRCAKDTAEDYVRKNFPDVPIKEVI